MPQSFNVVSQEETAGLGSNMDDVHSGVQVERSRRCCKYCFLPPKVQLIIASLAALISISAIVVHVSTNRTKKGSWPPPGVIVDAYTPDIYKTETPATFKLVLEAGKSYLQFTKMTTTSEYDFGSEAFAESLHMMIDGRLDVSDWTYEDQEKGLKIGVLFDQVAVQTEDSNQESTYYSSLASQGDSDFDEVLETMVGEQIFVDVDEDYEVVDEEDNENSLIKLEQEYSFGTTTGLSAIDQVTQITNLIAFLPDDTTEEHMPGDSWDVLFETDVVFGGRSTFEGYVMYNGYECAVITAWAYVDPDEDNTFGDGMDDFRLDTFIEIENGSVNAVIFWDVESNIPRFAKLEISMTTEVTEDFGDEDELDGVGSEEVTTTEIPMTEVLEMYVSPV